MTSKCYLGFALLLGLIFASGNADDSVRILSKYNQLVTSSTLNWLPISHYDSSKDIVIGGFEIISKPGDESRGNHADHQEHKIRKPLFVCRVLHTGIWVSGSQKEGEKLCTVSMHGTVLSYEKYDLLENVDTAARVGWVAWDKYHTPPLGAVATKDGSTMYVARHNDGSSSDPDLKYTHYIGTLNTDNKLGTIIYVKDDNMEGSAEKGEILTEAEPISYELSSVKLNWPKRRFMKQEPMILGQATIVNDGEEPVTLAEAFAYSYNYSMYWGQGHAILRGLNTTVSLFNRTVLPKIKWGIEEKENRTDVYTVEILLQPGTAVNVTLRANYTVMELSYTGTLISHYEDGDTKSRVIGGIRREETMMDVQPEFGPIYFVGNHSLVPTTTPAPTTIPTTVTTTTTTAATSRMTERVHQDIRSSDEVMDENMIVAPKKNDLNNMQGDDGGPLSLKNKVDTAQGGATLVSRSSLLTILPLLVPLIFRRIT